MRLGAPTVVEYLNTLPDDRRRAMTAVRRVIRKHLPEGYEEVMNWGMISYQVPLRRYPDTYNGQPLLYTAQASQKRHMAVYLTGIYADEAARRSFERRYKATGKRFDVGKSCVRFRTLDDLPLPLIGETVSPRGRLKHGILEDENTVTSLSAQFARNLSANGGVNFDMERFGGIDFQQCRYFFGGGVNRSSTSRSRVCRRPTSSPSPTGS